MNENAMMHAKLNILFVDCTQAEKSSDAPLSTADMEFHFRASPINVQAIMEFTGYDCVLMCVDPCSGENLEELDTVLFSCNEQGVPLFSLSSFDASWIENLMAQLGVEKHFRRVPSHEEMSLALSQSKAPRRERLDGIAQCPNMTS
jgi:hypothetical protein